MEGQSDVNWWLKTRVTMVGIVEPVEGTTAEIEHNVEMKCMHISSK